MLNIAWAKNNVCAGKFAPWVLAYTPVLVFGGGSSRSFLLFTAAFVGRAGNLCVRLGSARSCGVHMVGSTWPLAFSFPSFSGSKSSLVICCALQSRLVRHFSLRLVNKAIAIHFSASVSVKSASSPIATVLQGPGKRFVHPPPPPLVSASARRTSSLSKAGRTGRSWPRSVLHSTISL